MKQVMLYIQRKLVGLAEIVNDGTDTFSENNNKIDKLKITQGSNIGLFYRSFLGEIEILTISKSILEGNGVGVFYMF